MAACALPGNQEQQQILRKEFRTAPADTDNTKEHPESKVICVQFNSHIKCMMDDEFLKFAVIIAKHNYKWALCKHKQRNTKVGSKLERCEERRRLEKSPQASSTGAV